MFLGEKKNQFLFMKISYVKHHAFSRQVLGFLLVICGILGGFR